MHDPRYMAAWRERFRAEQVERERRRDRAWTVARELAEMLRQDLGASRVWLIGSLARGDFGLESDVDLVVEGIPPRLFFRACALVQRRAGDIEVDLAPREDLRPAAAAALDREGVLL